MTHFNRVHWLLLAAAVAATSARPAVAQTPIPLGLDCGFAYVINVNNSDVELENNACNGQLSIMHSATSIPQNCFSGTSTCSGCACVSTCIPNGVGFMCGVSLQRPPSFDVTTSPAPGFVAVHDNDNGAVGVTGNAPGYTHQEATSSTSTFTVVASAAATPSDPTPSASFVLPEGATCGFHHTVYSAGRTCMGFDPATSCPPGWTPRNALDVNSGTAHWVWCEYQDPKGLSKVASPLPVSGLACGVADVFINGGGTSTFATCMGYDTLAPGAPTAPINCPGMTPTDVWRDQGANAGGGLGYCTINSSTMPAHAPPPAPPPNCRVGTLDCCGDGSKCLTNCLHVTCNN
jgi:hypothetical protein